MKSARHFLPGSPESAEFAHLHAVKPRMQALDRSHIKRRHRGLSPKQQALGDGLLQKAVERVKEEARDRQCKYLRDFDTIYKTGYRTYQPRWDALADIIGPIMARLNIATMTLGWQDEKTGDYHLNRQRGLAEDSTDTKEWTVSRTLSALVDAKYARRKMRRIFHNGKTWITRVTIHIRPRFFIHLGLAHLLAPLRTDMKAKFNQVLESVGKRRQATSEKDKAAAAARKESHLKAQQARRQTDQKQAKMSRQEYARAYNERLAAFAMANPELSGRLRAEAFIKAHPDYALHPSQLP